MSNDRDAAHTYNAFRDESEAASGDNITYADEAEWMDNDEDDDYIEDDDEGTEGADWYTEPGGEVDSQQQ